jgi:hypothetical protein
MATLGDNVFNFYERYLKRTASKEVKLGVPSLYDNEMMKPTDDVKLTPAKRREIAHQSPVFMKGVRKKSLDSVRSWFKVEHLNGSSLIKVDQDAILSFEFRSNYKKKFQQAVKDAHIYGDGFLIIQFDSSDKGRALSDEPIGEPRNVHVLNPEFITSVEYLSGKNKSKDLYHFVYDDNNGNKQLIHPDRIQHIIVEEDSRSKLGLSKIDLLRNTIKSKKHVDIAVGRILSWFSHGLLDIKAYDLSKEEAKNVKKVAEMHPSVWLHDPEDFEIDVLQPESINPQPFMDFIVLNIASCLVMPVHVLTGIQVGRVTGAEVGFADYYRDIKDMQELIYTPLIEDLYQRIIEARGREWKYKIVWNQVYVDEVGEAEIMEKRTNFITKALQAGIISKEEAREMMNKGSIELNPSDVPPDPSPSPEDTKNPFKSKSDEDEE